MNTQKQLKKYASAFTHELSKHLKRNFKVDAVIYPTLGEGAIIDFTIHEGKRSEISFVDSVTKINSALKNIDQKMIGGNFEGVTFRGTNLYIEDQRILIIKGEDSHGEWSNAAALDDVKRIVSPKGTIMTEKIRNNETQGSLNERVLALEMSLSNRWDRWFGKNPGIVLGVVVTALCSGGWVAHTWQMERVTKEYQSRIDWLKEQQESIVKTERERCELNIKQDQERIKECQKIESRNLTDSK